MSSTRRPPQVEPLQRRQAQPGRRVVPGAEAHRRLDDDRAAVVAGLRRRRPTAGPRSKRPTRIGAERRLAAARPVVVGHVELAHAQPERARTVQRRGRPAASSRASGSPEEHVPRRRRTVRRWRRRRGHRSSAEDADRRASTSPARRRQLAGTASRAPASPHQLNISFTRSKTLRSSRSSSRARAARLLLGSAFASCSSAAAVPW